MSGFAYTTGKAHLHPNSVQHQNRHGHGGSAHSDAVLGSWSSLSHSITDRGLTLMGGHCHRGDPGDPSTMRGEFRLLIADDAMVRFCTDSWNTHPVWFSLRDGELTVASMRDSVAESTGAAYRARANTIYEFDRHTRVLTWRERRRFDLSQRVDNLDHVFEALETAVRERATPDTTTLLGTGMDSGVIMAAAMAQGLEGTRTAMIQMGPLTASRATSLALKRRRMHQPEVIEWQPRSRFEAELDRICEMHYGEGMKNEEALGLLSLCSQQRPRALINTVGGDELYADYAHTGRPMANYSKFGGLFPEELSWVWPWHTEMLERHLARENAIMGFYGVDRKYPLLDDALAQAWLNTTQRLKNMGHKFWMQEYLRQRDYPHDVPTGDHQMWRRDSAETGRLLMPRQAPQK